MTSRPGGHRRPEGGEPIRRRGGGDAVVDEQGGAPVPEHRLGRPVGDEGGGEEPEATRDRRPRRATGGWPFSDERLAERHDQHRSQADCGEQRQIPPLADVEEHGDEQGRERRTQPEQNVQRGERNLPPLRLERSGVGADRSQGQSEAETETGGHDQQHREGDGVGAHAVADDEQRHRHRVGGQSDDEHPLETDAPGERRQRQRTGDGQDHLRQEEQPVLAGGEVVGGRTGEDRGGGRYGDEAEPLEQPGRIDRDDLRSAWSRRIHRPPPFDRRPSGPHSTLRRDQRGVVIRSG